MEASIAGLWKTKSSSPFEIVGPLTALLIVNLAIRGHDIQKVNDEIEYSDSSVNYYGIMKT
jgi:hypothetical protein